MPTQHKVDHRFDNHLELPELPELSDAIKPYNNSGRERINAHKDIGEVLKKLGPGGEWRAAWVGQHYKVNNNQHPATIIEELKWCIDNVEDYSQVAEIQGKLRQIKRWAKDYDWTKQPGGQYAKLLANAGL